MKLSRALLIVLLLHVVAVSGIIAFNAIKTRESSFVPTSSTKAESQPSTTAESATQTGGSRPQIAAGQKENASTDDPKPSHSLSKPSLKDDHSDAPSGISRPVSRGRGTTGSQEATPKKPVSDGKTYIVKKGDNPVTIAKRLKVPYDDLMTLNHIEDPRKLRIGQKLLVPKSTKPKKTDGKAATGKEKKNEARHTKQKTHST